MFKLYDLNLREIPFPDGVMPLDIFVGSISKTRETETIPGRNGVMNYGFNYDSRPVRITLLAEGNDRIDYRLIRNAVFEIFDLHDVFYIEETDVPSRVLKVTIDESYQPDRLTRDDASFDINLRTLDSVFWESKYTTLELHDTGYSATAEKYGLVDNIDDEKVKYRFTENNFTVYNAGNVTVEPESMHLEILVKNMQSLSGFKIFNKTTGETHEHWQLMGVARDYSIKGMNTMRGDVNVFRYTNRHFISLVPGDNDFVVSGGSFDEIYFDFKYYYK